jgi:hypothetical protein
MCPWFAERQAVGDAARVPCRRQRFASGRSGSGWQDQLIPMQPSPSVETVSRLVRPSVARASGARRHAPRLNDTAPWSGGLGDRGAARRASGVRVVAKAGDENRIATVTGWLVPERHSGRAGQRGPPGDGLGSARKRQRIRAEPQAADGPGRAAGLREHRVVVYLTVHWDLPSFRFLWEARGRKPRVGGVGLPHVRSGSQRPAWPGKARLLRIQCDRYDVIATVRHWTGGVPGRAGIRYHSDSSTRLALPESLLETHR